jgi:hypothetical protein
MVRTNDDERERVERTSFISCLRRLAPRHMAQTGNNRFGSSCTAAMLVLQTHIHSQARQQRLDVAAVSPPAIYHISEHTWRANTRCLSVTFAHTGTIQYLERGSILHICMAQGKTYLQLAVGMLLDLR